MHRVGRRMRRLANPSSECEVEFEGSGSRGMPAVAFGGPCLPTIEGYVQFGTHEGARSNAATSKPLDPGSQLHLPRPGATGLLNHVPRALGDCFMIKVAECGLRAARDWNVLELLVWLQIAQVQGSTGTCLR